MRKRKAGQQNSSEQENRNDTGTPQRPEAEPRVVESPNLVPPQGEPLKLGAEAAPTLETPPVVQAAVADDKPAPAEIKADPVVEFPRIEPSRPDVAATAPRRWVPLAASFAIAAGVGAVGGSLATAGIGQLFTAQATPAPIDRSLRDSVAKLGTDLSALKTSIDGSAKSAGGQIAKLGERIDRVEKAQVEPSARLARIGEAIERLERRAAASGDTTGSIAAPTSLAAQPARPGAQPAKPPGPPIVEGWVLRHVVDGTALVQGRMGVLEIMPGDALPGIGRVESIRRQDGRWVVVTAKGLIVAH